MTVSLDLTDAISSVITSIVSLTVAIGIYKLQSNMKKKAAKKSAEQQIEQVNKYARQANALIVKLVDYLNNEVTNDLKIYSEDGELTDEEVELIRKAAKIRLYSEMSEEGLDAMQAVYGDLNDLFDQWIALAVENAKKPNGSGITSKEARGIANSVSSTSTNKAAIRQKLTSKLENISDSMNLSV